jgi:hypothetical protein
MAERSRISCVARLRTGRVPDDHMEAGLSQSVVHALPHFVRIRRFNDPVDRLDLKPGGISLRAADAAPDAPASATTACSWRPGTVVLLLEAEHAAAPVGLVAGHAGHHARYAVIALVGEVRPTRSDEWTRQRVLARRTHPTRSLRSLSARCACCA